MNSKERVMATIMGTTFDRRPFCGIFSMYGAKLSNCPLKKIYSDPDLYLKGVEEVVEKIDPDIITTPMFLSGEGEAFGSELQYFENQPPNLKKPVLMDLKQISDLEIPDIDSSPRLIYFRKILRGMKKRFGDNKIIAAILLSPVGLPIMITSLEKWLPAVLDKKDEVKKIMEITVPYFIKWAKTLTAEGADLLALPAVFTSPRIITREIVKEFVLPVFEAAFSELKIPVFLHHVGAKYLDFLDLLKDLPNVTGFIIDHRDSLSEARKKVGKDKVLMSGIDGPNFDKYSLDEIKNQIKLVLENMKNDPHFIFTMTGADVAYNASIENLIAIKKTINEFSGI